MAKRVDAASPLWKGLVDHGSKFDYKKLAQLQPLLAKFISDVPFLRLVEGKIVRTSDDLFGLIKVATALGVDQAADFLKRVDQFGDDVAQRVFTAFRKKNPRDLADLGEAMTNLGKANKLDTVAKGIGKGTWDADTAVKKYADLVANTAGDDLRYLNQLDDYADIPGSQRWVEAGFTGGIRLEMDTAEEMVGRGEKILEVNRNIPNPAKPAENLTDIDVITDGYAVSSKGKDFSKLTGKEYDNALEGFEGEMRHYAEFARQTGKKPALKIPAGQPLPKDFEDAIIKVQGDTGMIFERF